MDRFMGRGHQSACARGAGTAALLALALALGGCGSTSLSSFSSNIFGPDANTGMTSNAAGGTNVANADADVECPSVTVRNGAATLMIGSKPGEDEPAALDVRYQGSILRTARECHVAGGIMTMKVGIEGRIITGPSGGPGNVDVPLRIAVVQEGVHPRTIVSKFERAQVVVNNAIDRVAFTHVDQDVSFPMPQPASLIDAYVVYVGFDPIAAQPPAKKTPPPKRKPVAKKPKPNPSPQS
jgi:hypothetical protein